MFYEGTNQHVYQMWFDPTSGWHAQDVTAAAGAPPSSYTFAGGKFTLPQGTSVNLGSLVLVMQGDGNLVLYQNGVALWNTGTWGQNCSANQCFAAFQGDGNFVVYNGSTPLWNSQTGGNPGAQLALSAQLPNYIKISSSNQSTLWFAAQTISGKVLAGASGLPGVAVSLSGTALASIATDSNGNYLFSVPVGGNYTVTPSLSGYIFNPSSQTFSNVSGSQSANFSGTASFSISGQALRNGSALSGVTVTLSGSSSGSATTSSNGAVSFSVPAGGNYSIVPSLSGYTFSPASSTYNGLSANQTTTFIASSGSGDLIPVPPPPTARINCGVNYADAGSGANPQTVYAPNSSNTLYTYCENPSNGQVVACNISLSTTYYQYRNGHFHSNPPPPVSSISPSSGYTGSYSNWQIPVTLTTTQVGQIEALYISDDDNGDVVHYDYGVGYLGSVYIDNSNVFYQTGGNTTNHGDNTWNHYMTVNAATGLQNAATFYINSYNPGQKVCINDMALPIGGKFDIHDDWQSPHISHDQGTAADVAAAAGQCPGSYIVNLNTFRQACINVGHSLSANTITEGNHVHCRWPN